MARSPYGTPFLTLDMYRRISHIPRCVFNGVENPDETTAGCDRVFQQWQRDEISQSLYDAGGLLADELGYWLGAHYLVDEGHSFTHPMTLNYGHIIGGGIEGLTEVTPSASDFTTDPATITVAQADFTDETEIKIVETSSGLQINVDSVAEVGTDYVISISQCKLIEWDDLEEQIVAIEYDAAFPAAIWLKLADLTVYRSYLDTSSQATITFGPSCVCCCEDGACTGTDYTGCVYVMKPEISKISVSIANYSDGSWTCGSLSCGCYHGDKVKVRYKAGHEPTGWERAQIALANTFLDFPPCGCSAFDYRMNRDRNIPAVLTRERIECPWGLTDGAWFAWKWAQARKHIPAFMAG